MQSNNEESETPKNSFYDLLGVAKESTFDEIKKSYRKLALKYHPDKIASSGVDDNGEKMKDIALAYAVLSDDNKRKIYDNFGLEGIERNDLLSKDQSIVPFKLWMCGIFGWVTILIVDYIVGIPLEWIGIMITLLFLLLKNDIPKKEKLMFLLLVFLFDITLYFIVPSGYVKFFSNVLAITSLLAAQNSMVKYVDFSTFIWILAIFIEYMREFEFENFWIYLSGINVLGISLIACGIFVHYFQTNYVLEGAPSTISDGYQKLSPHISPRPFTLFLIFIPLWIVEYFTSMNLISLLFLALVFYIKISNKEMKLMFAVVLVVGSLFVYYLFSPETYFHLSNFVIYYCLLRILLMEENFANDLPKESNSTTPETTATTLNSTTPSNNVTPVIPTPTNESQIKVDIDPILVNKDKTQSSEQEKITTEKKENEEVTDSQSKNTEQGEKEEKLKEEVQHLLQSAKKFRWPSISYFFVFFIFCWIEFNRESSYYLTYLSIAATVTSLHELYNFEFS